MPRDMPYNNDVVKAIIQEALVTEGRGAQARLARALHVRPQTVNKWASGENKPDPDKWGAIEEALGLPPNTLQRAAFGVAQPPAQRSNPTGPPSDLDARFAAMERQLADLASTLDALVRTLQPPPPARRAKQ